MAALTDLYGNATARPRPTTPQRRSTSLRSISERSTVRPASGGMFHEMERTGERSPAAAGASSDPVVPPVMTAGREYDAQWRESLARSRSNIATSLRNALSETNRQEQLAMQQVGLLPGQLSQLTDAANAQLTQLGTNADAAQAATGLQSFTPAGTALDPLQGAVAAASGFQQGAVPLIQLGTQDLYARQRGALNQAQLSALMEIDAEERQMSEARAAEERTMLREDRLRREDRQFEREQTRAQLAAQRSSARTDFADRLALLQAETGVREDSAETERLAVSGITGITPAEMRDIRSSAPYRYAMQLYNEGEFTRPGFTDDYGPIQFGKGDRKKLSLDKLLERYKGPQYEKLRKTLQYDLGGSTEG